MTYEYKRQIKENEKKSFQMLLKKEKFPEAKKLADILSKNGVEDREICYIGFPYVKSLLSQREYETATSLCEIFSDYSWPSWLIDD